MRGYRSLKVHWRASFVALSRSIPRAIIRFSSPRSSGSNPPPVPLHSSSSVATIDRFTSLNNSIYGGCLMPTHVEEMTESIVATDTRGTTDAFCRLIIEGHRLSELIVSGLGAAAPYLNVPAHTMIRPDGDLKGVN